VEWAWEYWGWACRSAAAAAWAWTEWAWGSACRSAALVTGWALVAY
jgi:hypothetical protein